MRLNTARSIPVALPLEPQAPVAFPRLVLTRSRRIKRSFDIFFAVLFSIAALPVFLLIAVAVLLESGRPIFFGHNRVGRGGRTFRLWKFRTMRPEGDAILARHLEMNPEAAEEWRLNRKLRQDPRVTRVGRWLRRASLDELPQIWNILRGEMSVAGPRPIVRDEILNYGTAYPLYALTAPGLTGLWQVSGRNDTTYRQRVELDAAYVRNWSPALDLRLLFKTVRVVLNGKGAY